jgi:hypothetical protein
MNLLIVNNKKYVLPDEEDTLMAVINHLDMVKNGKKEFINLYSLDGNKHKLSRTYINQSKIELVREQDFKFEMIDGWPCARVYVGGQKTAAYISLNTCDESDIPDSVKKEYKDYLDMDF